MVNKYGTSKRDIIEGSSGDDLIYGYGGNDIIYASEREYWDGYVAPKFNIYEFATAASHTEKDIVYAGAGNDIITGFEVYIGDGFVPENEDRSFVHGGKGYDILVVTAFNWGFNNTLKASEIYNSINTISVEKTVITDFSGLGTVTAIGTSKADVFSLGSESKIYGGKGNDILESLKNDSEIHGGRGQDILIGGSGDNILHGGAGADTFVLDGSYRSYSVIEDYKPGKDKIYIDVYAIHKWNADVEFDYHSVPERPKFINENIHYDARTGAIKYDGDVIATVVGAPSYTDLDIFVF